MGRPDADQRGMIDYPSPFLHSVHSVPCRLQLSPGLGVPGGALGGGAEAEDVLATDAAVVLA